MTTRKKKSLHEKRHLSFAEYGALLGTRAMLVNGDLQKMRELGAHVFNMRVVYTDDGTCGTISCIGGTMALIMGINPGNYIRCASGGLERLFYPPREYVWRKITPKQAIQAIDNFLSTGKPCWQLVLRKNQRWL